MSMLKKYTVFFSTEIRKILAADGPERGAPWPAAYRNFRAANQFAPSLLQLMLTKPDLDSEEMKYAIDQCFMGVWRTLYQHWDAVMAAYEKADRGTVYVGLVEDDGDYTYCKAVFGELEVTSWMSYSSRPAAHFIMVGGVCLSDTRNEFSSFPNPAVREQSETV